MKDIINASLLDLVRGFCNFIVQLANSPFWKSAIVLAGVILLLGGAAYSIILAIETSVVAFSYVKQEDIRRNNPVKKLVLFSAIEAGSVLALLIIAVVCICLIHFPVSWL